MNRTIRFKLITLVAVSWIIFILSPQKSLALIAKKIEINLVDRLEMAETINFEKHFQDLEIEGSIIIYDLNNDRTFQHNPQRNTTPFSPASTFKILNSLIALETGVISDEISVLTWDGVQRNIPEWNRDLNMREAFKISAVWFYQVLARRVGYDRMQHWITQAQYGNQKIGDRSDIDRFWLDGELRISPQEQIQFLRHFYNNDLPFSDRALSIVKDITIVEKTPDYTIRAKTGWVWFEDDEKTQIGWYVGYLEKSDNTYFFATNIDIHNQTDLAARIELTRRCFQELTLL
ncbi:class D beta-lactamase [Oscillatoriales cyanobacterium LEGE 11467]|uniref:Beta-lactamase n=1 Tax=Zarconia navalis LEGE 11467 TaxID=1828826 RepID=A0A928W1C3_9CYAN|nr:class D beta-lactamase [Zarconia navalis]MBE9041460.1 class D beta-lactamase [Zarconia navalis LEGE 11467]